MTSVPTQDQTGPFVQREGSISSVDDASLGTDDFQLVNRKCYSPRKSSTTSQNTNTTTTNGEECEDEAKGEENFVPDTNVKSLLPKCPESFEVMYGQESRNRAISNLIFFSVLMFTVPLAVIFISYRYFLDHLHWPQNTASLYAGILGAISVYIVVAIFIWVAYREEKEISEKVEAIEQAKKDT